MTLVFLHGLPASGKFTVGQELAALTGFEIFHNHRVVDEVLQTHAFGSPGFVVERDRRWRAYFTRHPGSDREKVIFTFNPERSVPQVFVDWLFAGMSRRGIRLHSIELTCSESEIENRLGSTQRRGFRKLTDPALYRQLRDSGYFSSPVIPRTDLRIDTGKISPAKAATRIARHFGLG